MKIKNSIGNIIRKKNSNKNNEEISESSRILKTMFYFLLILLVVAMAAVILLKRGSQDNGISMDPFKDCSILEKNCMDTNCAFYSSCGDAGRKACKIYDCGNSYGVYFVDRDGNIERKTEAKPDMKAIEDEKTACKGTMNILEQKCADNKYEARVKVETEGDCKIGSFFLFDEDDHTVPNSFSLAGDNTYMITSGICKKIVDIVPASENGMILEL